MRFSSNIPLTLLIQKVKPFETIGDTLGIESLVGISDIFNANANEITYLGSRRYLHRALQLKKVVILISKEIADKEALKLQSCVLFVVDEPDLEFNNLLKYFFQEKTHTELHPLQNRIVGNNCKVGKNIDLGPNTFVGNDVSIGDYSCISPNCFIGNNVVIGNNCHIHPNVTIYNNTLIGDNVTIKSGSVIGLNGFISFKKNNEYHDVYSVGNVVIEDFVSIGGCVCIDRGRTSSSIIGRGTKIDNLVQIGHGVKIGANCVIGCGSGISGEVEIGNNTRVGPQSGIDRALKIGSNVLVHAKTEVYINLKDNVVFKGREYQKLIDANRIKHLLDHWEPFTQHQKSFATEIKNNSTLTREQISNKVRDIFNAAGFNVPEHDVEIDFAELSIDSLDAASLAVTIADVFGFSEAEEEELEYQLEKQMLWGGTIRGLIEKICMIRESIS